MKETQVMTGKVRFGFPAVFKPVATELSEDLKYRLTIYIKKSDTVTVKKIEAAIAAAFALGKEKGKYPATTKLEKNNQELFKYPLKDGDKKENAGPEYEGCYYMNLTANPDFKPGVIDIDKNDILSPDEFYAGCYGRVILNIFAFGPKPSKGLAGGLIHVQKLADGTRLDGSVAASSAFDDEFSDEDFWDEDEGAPVQKRNTAKNTSTNVDEDDWMN